MDNQQSLSFQSSQSRKANARGCGLLIIVAIVGVLYLKGCFEDSRSTASQAVPKSHPATIALKAAASNVPTVGGVSKREYEVWLNRAKQHVEKLDALWKQLDQTQPSKTQADSFLLPLCKQGQALTDSYGKWIQTSVSDRNASITDPQQLKLVNGHDELHSKLATLFCCFHDETYPEFTWVSQKETSTNPDLKQVHRFRVEHLKFMAEAVNDVQNELAKWNR